MLGTHRESLLASAPFVAMRDAELRMFGVRLGRTTFGSIAAYVFGPRFISTASHPFLRLMLVGSIFRLDRYSLVHTMRERPAVRRFALLRARDVPKARDLRADIRACRSDLMRMLEEVAIWWSDQAACEQCPTVRAWSYRVACDPDEVLATLAPARRERQSLPAVAANDDAVATLSPNEAGE